jgi:hypothetical protein
LLNKCEDGQLTNLRRKRRSGVDQVNHPQQVSLDGGAQIRRELGSAIRDEHCQTSILRENSSGTAMICQYDAACCKRVAISSVQQ